MHKLLFIFTFLYITTPLYLINASEEQNFTASTMEGTEEEMELAFLEEQRDKSGPFDCSLSPINSEEEEELRIAFGAASSLERGTFNSTSPYCRTASNCRPASKGPTPDTWESPSGLPKTPRIRCISEPSKDDTPPRNRKLNTPRGRESVLVGAMGSKSRPIFSWTPPQSTAQDFDPMDCCEEEEHEYPWRIKKPRK